MLSQYQLRLASTNPFVTRLRCLFARALPSPASIRRKTRRYFLRSPLLYAPLGPPRRTKSLKLHRRLIARIPTPPALQSRFLRKKGDTFRSRSGFQRFRNLSFFSSTRKPINNTTTFLSPNTTPFQPSAGCVAILQPDLHFDAVVVTTLAKHPFQSHQDLLEMSRSELVQLVKALNERLPEVQRMDLSGVGEHDDAGAGELGEGRAAAVSEEERKLRGFVEVLVGIRASGETAGGPRLRREVTSDSEEETKATIVEATTGEQEDRIWPVTPCKSARPPSAQIPLSPSAPRMVRRKKPERWSPLSPRSRAMLERVDEDDETKEISDVDSDGNEKLRTKMRCSASIPHIWRGSFNSILLQKLVPAHA